MNQKRAKTKLIELIKRLAQSLPSAIPYVGAVYSDYANAKDMEELKSLLSDSITMSVEQLSQLAGQVNHNREALNKVLSEILLQVQESQHVSTAKATQSTHSSNFRINQRANRIINVAGDLTIHESNDRQPNG